jgi:hypothetical protein
MRLAVVGIMVMLTVRTRSQEFCTRSFAFYMLNKDETTKYGTGALYVMVGPVLYAAAITQLQIMFVTIVGNQRF